MKNITIVAAGLAVISSLVFISVGTASDNKVPYPEDYRNWTHVKTMLIEPGHVLENPFQGIHHIYANKKALKGLKSGSYANGSVLVFDLLKYNEQDKAIHESERKLVGVMYKNKRKYSDTGGWGFEGFAGNSKTKRLTTDAGSSCFSCHAGLEDSGFVFSKFRK